MQPQSEILDRIRTTLVDLMDEVQKYTGRKVTPEDFRSVRTVGDLAAVMQRLMHA
jgi:acyl carrier protein